MLVPCTTAVRFGSSEVSPASTTACSAAASANWANRSVPDSTCLLIQSDGRKPCTTVHQAGGPGLPAAQGAGPTATWLCSSPLIRLGTLVPSGETAPLPVITTPSAAMSQVCLPVAARQPEPMDARQPRGLIDIDVRIMIRPPSPVKDLRESPATARDGPLPADLTATAAHPRPAAPRAEARPAAARPAAPAGPGPWP